MNNEVYKDVINNLKKNVSYNKNCHELTEHLFRNEYGKMVSVITRYIGTENIETAEDIIQETLVKAVDYWQHNGIPENPQGWLYTTAKNITFNILKRKKYQIQYESSIEKKSIEFEEFDFSEKLIIDDQLRMMFVCCHPSISQSSQIALVLKILCGFSITEIANAFFSTTETINKRLVRGRKQLRKNKVSFEITDTLDDNLIIILKTIYLLFNEGYSPSQKNELIRYDLCLEAIRLAEILAGNKISSYLILAAVSANHCIAESFEKTNWEEILSLYDSLLLLENSPIIRLNRCVALAKAKGNKAAIEELLELESNSDLATYYLFYSTLAELYKLENETEKAVEYLKKAIPLTKNKRDSDFLKKKLIETVPVS